MKTLLLVQFFLMLIIFSSCLHTEKQLNEAQRLKNTGDFNGAIKKYNEILEKDKNNISARNDRGVIYFHLSKYDLAIDDFTFVIKKDPNYSLAYYNRAKSKLGKGDLFGAEKDCVKLQTIDNNNNAWNLLYSTVLIHLKEINKASKIIESVYDSDRLNSEAVFLQGAVFLERRFFNKAIGKFKRALELDENFTEAYSNLGDCYVKKGDFDSAMIVFNEWIVIDSINPIVYQKKGFCELQIGSNIQAETDFTKSLSLDKHYTTFGLRGLARKNQGKYIEAIADYKAGIKLNNKYPILFYNLGVCQSELNQLDSACFNFQKAAQLGMPNAKEMIKKYCD